MIWQLSLSPTVVPTDMYLESLILLRVLFLLLRNSKIGSPDFLLLHGEYLSLQIIMQVPNQIN